MFGWFRRWRGRKQMAKDLDLRQRVAIAQEERDRAQRELTALRDEWKKQRGHS